MAKGELRRQQTQNLVASQDFVLRGFRASKFIWEYWSNIEIMEKKMETTTVQGLGFQSFRVLRFYGLGSRV